METQKNHLKDINYEGVNFQPSGIVTKPVDEFVVQNNGRHFLKYDIPTREQKLREVHAACLKAAGAKEEAPASKKPEKQTK
jgi:hypothetical protein